ncbi:MAG: GNAT family N-acetyltransferase [Treponema sp.]
MTFPLSEKLVSGIVNALENQERRFLVDAQTQVLVEAEGITQDENRFYGLPEWNSAAGFALRADFVEQLRFPTAQNELRRVLRSGRGVFKSFKNVLREFPEAEKRWHRYKNAAMRRLIGEWYNSLSDAWGLERLELEIEDGGEQLYDDFSFCAYVPSDFDEVFRCFSHAEADGTPDFVKSAVIELQKRHFQSFCKGAAGFVCRSIAGEFAGFITASPVLENAGETFVLTGLYVSEQFRGLGIGTELVSLCLSSIKKRKKESALIAFAMLPDSVLHLLQKQGFEQAGTGLFARTI